MAFPISPDSPLICTSEWHTVSHMASAIKSPPKGKTHRLVTRVSDDDKAIISHAAAIAGQTLSAFVLTQARKAALETFDIHHRIILNAAESQRFVDALLATPRKPSSRIKRAIKAYRKTVTSGF